ncbi:MAG: hypothetical protein Q9209_002982 [Squamulea sp. 1 TL-2023]
MARIRLPDSKTSATNANANSTFEKTLKSLGNESIPPEYLDDFEEYIPSDDHGSSTHQDKVERSSELCSSGFDDSLSLDESGSEYQPDLAQTVQDDGGVDIKEESDVETESHYADTPGLDVDMDEEPDDLAEDQDELEEQEEEGEEASRPAKKRGAGRSKKNMAKPVGTVRINKDELEWFDPSQKVWRPAVYHQDIRKRLIADADRLGQYRYDLAHGKDKLDVTAFHPAYAQNGPERHNWPKILFQYGPTVTDFLHPKPPIWQLHDGRVVVDCNNDAMIDYPQIPVTLARNADPWLLLTCMRLNNNISIQDLRGRMPGDRRMHMADPLGRNRISMNMTRFRKYGCCITWNSIRKEDTQREYLDKKLPRRCIRLNSTESFRKLHAWEVAELELQDAGRFLKRTRSRIKDITPDKRRQVYNKKHTEFEQLKTTFEHAHPVGPDDYDAEDKEFAKQQKTALLSNRMGISGSPAIKTDNITDSALVVKPGGRRRGGQRSSLAKDTRILAGEMPTDSERQQRTICPRHHQDYAGFLTRAPSNVREAQLLYDLLGPSRYHYQMNTSKVAPETFADECYKCQFSDLQNAVIDWHEMHPILKPMDPAKLIGLQYVVDGQLYWNTDWNETWFGRQPMVNPDEIF